MNDSAVNTDQEVASQLSVNQTADLKRRVSWYVKVRWVFLIGLAAPGIIGQYLEFGFDERVVRHILLILVALAVNAVIYFLNRLKNRSFSYHQTLGATMVIVDVLVSTYLVYSNGGIESRTVIVYAVPIIMSSALFNLRFVLMTAGLAAGLYNAVVALDVAKVIEVKGVLNPSLHDNSGYLLVTVMFYTAAILIIAVISNYVSRLLKTSEEAVRAQAVDLLLAQQVAKIGNWSWDIPKNVVTWSGELYRMFGVEAGRPINYESYISLVYDPDRAQVDQIIKRAYETGQPFNVNHRVKRADGSIIWVHAEAVVVKNSSGKSTRMFGTAQDITASRSAENELWQRSAELEKLNQLMIGREKKMIELKQRIRALEEGSSRSVTKNHVSPAGKASKK